ncbi:MAG: DNA primase [Chroococcales cyanobacterium]
MDVPSLHPDTIEEVKQRVDIVDVISDSVVLRKRGKSFLGLCPFHSEKTPSFNVSPEKQVYYCFGCSAGGNVFKFLMELEKRSFSEVVLDLARRYQISVKTQEPAQRQELQRQLTLREQLYEIMAVAATFYQHALRQPQGEKALNYLYSERKLTEETIQQFGLGYAPAGWETLYRYLVEQKRFSVALVEQAGLIKQRSSGNGYYDQFRDRLMIPILDIQGRTIAFGSRTLGDDQPKYLNSPETPLFDKSKTLYNLDKARSGISQADQAIVVEGYFDAIALSQAGINHVVASLGTAFSQDQLKQLSRYTESKKIIFNFDADSAGITATQRAISEIETLVYSGQIQLRILNLPGGKDADEFLQSAPNASEMYRTALEKAPLWIDWEIQQLIAGQDLNQADQRQKVAHSMVKLLQKIDNLDLRSHYVTHCAEILSHGDSRITPINAKSLLKQLRKPITKSNVQSKQSRSIDISVSSQQALLEEAETLLLRVYLHCPQHRSEIYAAFEEEESDLLFTVSSYRLFWQSILEVQQNISSPFEDSKNQLISLLQDHLLNLPEPIKDVDALFQLREKTKEDILRTPYVIQAAIACLEKVKLEKHRRYCFQKWEKIDSRIDPENWKFYLQEGYNADRKIQELERQRLFTLEDILDSPMI